MTDHAKTLIVMATYNERENLPRLVEEVFASVPDADLLVIDDNSPDGTGDWCDAQGADDPRLRCIHRAGKLGLGTAVLDGLRYALTHDYQYVVNMDADGSHPPCYLPELIAAAQQETAPVAIGSRYTAGGRIKGWPLRRRLMSRAVNLLARWALGLRVRDCSGAFRCYPTSLLRQLDFDTFLSHGYSLFEEMLWRLQRQDASFVEIPIVFVDREKGTSKINPREALRAVLTLCRLGVRHWFGRGRPV